MQAMQQTVSVKKSEAYELKVLKAEPNLMPLLKVGDIVEARLVEKSNRGAYFDIPRVGMGIIYGSELSNSRDIVKRLNIGDTVGAKIALRENEDGLIELSLSEASKQKAWQEIKELKDEGEPVKVKIVSSNSGGLIADLLGVQAFLPASQLSPEHYPQDTEGNRSKMLEALKQFVGQELSVKIINFTPRTNKLILSEREVLSEGAKEALSKYKQGDVVNCIVSGVANFGAFVRFADDPNIEGLIYISELSHSIIENPKEIIKVGDMVKASILEIKDGRVSLSIKSLEENPWDKVAEKYKEGSVISGTVYRMTPFGAFVKLDPQISGLIHVSEFGSLEELKKNLELGGTYNFLISSVKPETKRIILKLAK
ncbi:MAG: S1 RNA-binding domain-containing protein [Patescibacteria group bacterium]|nr:S1 RNA-binding domain-containing protein [Patescibacteria group bacterium]